MWDELSPHQLQTLRRALAFAVILAVGDICVLGALLYLGVIQLLW